MQSFTEEIKKEIIANVSARSGLSDEEKLSLLSAFIRTSGGVFSREGRFGFEIITENERTAELATDLLESNFSLNLTVSGAKFDLMSGRDKLAFECLGTEAENFLIKAGLLKVDGAQKLSEFGIADRLIEVPNLKSAFLKGAFLGGGSCTLPDEGLYSRTGYHFEVVFQNKITAGEFCELLLDFDILAKLVTRKDSAVVYVKRNEVISELLAIMGCTRSVEKLNNLAEMKDKQNNANRVNNCSVSNIDKTLTASVNQVRAIEVISRTIGLKSLDKLLFDVAVCRLADKNASMQELAERLKISKSCLNHRMRKILEIARSLGQD